MAGYVSYLIYFNYYSFLFHGRTKFQNINGFWKISLEDMFNKKYIQPYQRLNMLIKKLKSNEFENKVNVAIF